MQANPAETAFRKVLAKAKEYDHLVLLRREGWEEQLPSEDAWHFCHPSYPRVSVTWFHDGRVRVSSGEDLS